MTPAELLRNTRAYIERGWTQNAMARSANGIPVEAFSKNACEWCLTGAMERARRDAGPDWPIRAPRSLMNTAFGKLCEVNGINPGRLVSWNDSKTRVAADVLAVIDRTLEHLDKAA